MDAARADARPPRRRGDPAEPARGRGDCPRRRTLGEGWHHGAGLPHAEVEAVRACAATPRGATLYVTLEPCSTQGRTPPCTDLILRSGIARVVVGCADPNPRHAGRGFDLLRRAGVEVAVG